MSYVSNDTINIPKNKIKNKALFCNFRCKLVCCLSKFNKREAIFSFSVNLLPIFDNYSVTPLFMVLVLIK